MQVRVYNLETDDSAALPLPSTPAPADGSARTGASGTVRPSALAYHDSTGSLFVASLEGTVSSFKSQPPAAVGQAATWESSSAHNVTAELRLGTGAAEGATNIYSLSVGPRGEEVAALCPTALAVIRKLPIVHKSRAGLAAIQLSATELVVHELRPSNLSAPAESKIRNTGGQTRIKCFEPIEGIDLTRQHVLIYGEHFANPRWPGGTARLSHALHW